MCVHRFLKQTLWPGKDHGPIPLYSLRLLVSPASCSSVTTSKVSVVLMESALLAPSMRDYLCVCITSPFPASQADGFNPQQRFIHWFSSHGWQIVTGKPSFASCSCLSIMWFSGFSQSFDITSFEVESGWQNLLASGPVMPRCFEGWENSESLRELHSGIPELVALYFGQDLPAAERTRCL